MWPTSQFCRHRGSAALLRIHTISRHYHMTPALSLDLLHKGRALLHILLGRIAEFGARVT